ncbi:hypothetical protein VKT23_020286 [Stygiomarasmius scandens]|uniref:Uncharacterized protein n=1 Tax=Marasmiellus scandens TaxID=2682957 RepID=A0ABR1IKL5_9AGAR
MRVVYLFIHVMQHIFSYTISMNDVQIQISDTLTVITGYALLGIFAVLYFKARSELWRDIFKLKVALVLSVELVATPLLYGIALNPCISYLLLDIVFLAPESIRMLSSDVTAPAQLLSRPANQISLAWIFSCWALGTIFKYVQAAL